MSWVISLLIVAGLFLTVAFVLSQDADAFTRAEDKALKAEIDTAEKLIVKLDVLIDKQKVIMKNIEDEIEVLKVELRQTKANATTSWTALESVEAAENAIIAADKRFNTARDQYLSFLSQKSDNITLLKVKESLLLVQGPYIDYSKSNIKVSVILSKTCLTMIHAGINSTCPTNLDLVSLDTSDTSISGEFEYDHNGFYHRASPNLKDSWRAYDFDDTPRIFVDPPKGMIDRTRSITLQANFDTYVDPGNLTMQSEVTYANFTNAGQIFSEQISGETYRVVYHDIYVDNNCRSATVNADDWMNLLPHVIYYMTNNCEAEFKTFNNVEVIPISYTEQDITTSAKYKADKRMEYIKEFCVFKYKACS